MIDVSFPALLSETSQEALVADCTLPDAPLRMPVQDLVPAPRMRVPMREWLRPQAPVRS